MDPEKLSLKVSLVMMDLSLNSSHFILDLKLVNEAEICFISGKLY